MLVGEPGGVGFMRRPIAGPFQASQTQMFLADDATGGGALARRLDVGIGVLALLAAGCVWAGAYIWADQPDAVMVLEASCIALLVPGVVGLWLLRQTKGAPQSAVAQIYGTVFRHVAENGPMAMPRNAGSDGYRGLAGLLGELSTLTRRLRAGRERTMQAADAGNLALQLGRRRARDEAFRIRENAAILTGTASEMDLAGARLASEISAVAVPFDLADDALGRAIDNAAGLAGAVRSTTAEAERMTTLAIRLSQIAQDSFKTIGALDDRSARLELALDPIGRALQAAQDLAVSILREAASDTGASADHTQAAAKVSHVAEACRAALDTALAVIGELAAETREANRRVADMSELVRASHDTGEAVGHAVQQQAVDIGRLLHEMYEARSGFVILRAGVAAVAQAGIAQRAAAEPVCRTAQHLPTHADAMAEIMRSIPDFSVPDY